VTSEDQRDRKFGNHLNYYYDEVIECIHDAQSFQIFGPGEAKGELEKRIEHEGLKAHILVIETVDKMTDHQISTKVWERFLGLDCGIQLVKIICRWIAIWRQKCYSRDMNGLTLQGQDTE